MDPYRVLGLEPGAGDADVKRAYRRLAKALHPDAAGAGSLPAFLAVQDAYEQLTGTKVRTVRPTAAAGAATEPFREPWRADPARARAAREQARTRRGWQGGATRSAGRTGSTGSTGRSGSSSSAGATGAPDAEARSGLGNAGGATDNSGTRRRGGSRARSTRKATLGSTSYDDARDPADRSWAGASWYGPTTGEYWHVNPREYADPRKHGPGYSSRGRSGTAMPDEPSLDREPGTSPWTEPETRPRPEPTIARNAPQAERRSLDTSMPAGWASPADPIRRLGRVLVAWPPLGLAAAAALGATTGCSTYSTACDNVDRLLPWLAQALIVGVLLLAPLLARPLAAGTVSALIALLPGAAIITALGGASAPEGPPVLAGWLVVAWLVGIAWAINRQLRGMPGDTTPGAPPAGTAPPQGARP